MLPIDISEFKKRYPILYAHFEFQTRKEYERANIKWIIDDARRCDYETTAKVIFHKNEVLKESWVGKKIFQLSESIKTGKPFGKKRAKHYEDRINSAIKGVSLSDI